MRRSFGNGNMNGGNGTGGSGMIRAVHNRPVMKTATPEQFSTNSNSFNKNKSKLHSLNTGLSLSSSSVRPFSTLVNLPSVSAVSSFVDEELVEWECVDGVEDGDEVARGVFEDFVFGNVPTGDEVSSAVFALQKVLGSEATSPTSLNRSIGSEMDWIEPSMHLCNSSMLQSRGSDRVYDAFHLLQSDPSVQRMVVSLSSDKAVWDAVLNNEFVRELRDSIRDEEVEERETSDESDGDTNPVLDLMGWIIVNAREKIMQLIDNIAKVVSEAFPHGNEDKKGGKSDLFEEKLKTSLFLSIVVLLIVVVTRAQSA